MLTICMDCRRVMTHGTGDETTGICKPCSIVRAIRSDMEFYVEKFKAQRKRWLTEEGEEAVACILGIVIVGLMACTWWPV